MYFIGLDVHKKTISYCVKDAAGGVYQEGKIGSTRWELDEWIRRMPQPRRIAMEATIFTGWIYDHLLPHAEKVKVAHPLLLRAIAAAKKKNDRIDAARSLIASGATSCPSATWPDRDPRPATGAARCATATCWSSKSADDEPCLRPIDRDRSHPAKLQ